MKTLSFMVNKVISKQKVWQTIFPNEGLGQGHVLKIDGTNGKNVS